MDTITATVNVTQEDIAKGLKGECDRCPVALAGKRAFPDAEDVLVCVTNMSVILPREAGEVDARWYEGSLPIEAGSFINGFDDHREVEPFSFEVTLTREF